MDLIDRVNTAFQEHVEAVNRLRVSLAPNVVSASEAVAVCLLNSGKLLICGNGGSAADSQHFCGELVNKFQRERLGLPAISLASDASVLTAIGNDVDFQAVFSRQVSTVGMPGDVLIVLSTSGNSRNIIQAVHAAHARDLRVIALTGNQGGDLVGNLSEADIVICVDSCSTPRIQEMHMLILHSICDVVDCLLLGHE